MRNIQKITNALNLPISGDLRIKLLHLKSSVEKAATDKNQVKLKQINAQIKNLESKKTVQDYIKLTKMKAKLSIG